MQRRGDGVGDLLALFDIDAAAHIDAAEDVRQLRQWRVIPDVMPEISARPRGSAMTPKPAATAAPSPSRLEPMKASSHSRPAWLSAAMALRVNRHSSP